MVQHDDVEAAAQFPQLLFENRDATGMMQLLGNVRVRPGYPLKAQMAQILDQMPVPTTHIEDARGRLQLRPAHRLHGVVVAVELGDQQLPAR